METFDAYKASARLNSPRSVDACRRQGIDPRELLYVSQEDYAEKLKGKKLEKELLRLRWEHHEKKRKEKLRVLAEVRKGRSV